MEIRAERPEDIDAIHDVVAAAFGRADEADLVDRLRASTAFVPELSLVAVEGGEIVGHVLFSYVQLGDRSVLSLAPLAVKPSRQRDGIGVALTNKGLELADAMGEPLCVVLGHPEYYPRFGFEAARPVGIEPASDDIPDEAWMVKKLSAYDAALRGRVVYPPAFDGL